MGRIRGIALLALTGCGVTATVKGSVNTSGTQTVNINLAVPFFNDFCANQLGPTATQAEIDTCVNVETGKLIDALDNGNYNVKAN